MTIANGQIRLTVSLVSVNQRHHLERLLPSLRPALERISSEVLLVDNRSTDSTAEFVRENYPEVLVRKNDTRTGYGGNNNLNIAIARGQYIAVMNSDMTVEPTTFSRLIAFMDDNPGIGIACPRVLNEDGSDQCLNKRYPTIVDLFLRRFVPEIVRPLFRRRMDRYEMRDVGYDNICDVESVTGAFMFCRADVLRRLAGFDPRFFMYFEDIDLCRRVQQTHRTVYLPAARVVHYWQRSAHKSWYWAGVFIQSAWRYFNRWGYRFI